MTASTRYMPRPRRNPGLRIPVHIMRRFFNSMVKKCEGIEISQRGTGDASLHSVVIHFETGAEASWFYRSLQAIYETRDHTRYEI